MEDLSAEQYLALEHAAVVSDEPEGVMARRTFLRGLAGVGAVGGAVLMGLRLDTKVGEQLYGSGEPEIGVVPDLVAERKFPYHYNLVFGGFGVYNIQHLAQAVHPALRHYGQTAYIKNSNGGLYINKQKQRVLDFLKERNATSVIMYGHSFSGMETVEIGQHLLENGIEVQAEILDCTPEVKYDLRPGKLAGAEFLAAVDKYTESLDLSGGPATRFAIESLSRVLDGRIDYRQIAWEALRKLSPKNCSNKLLEDQAHYICAFDGAEYGPSYPATTTIAKLRPRNWDADQTINNLTSLAGWRSHAFPHMTVHDVPIVGGGHANPGATGAKYTEAIMRVGQEFGFYTGSPVNMSHRTHYDPN